MSTSVASLTSLTGLRRSLSVHTGVPPRKPKKGKICMAGVEKIQHVLKIAAFKVPLVLTACIFVRVEATLAT